MNWLQIRLFGPHFSSFSTNSYGYYSQMSQKLFSNGQIFASALIVNRLLDEFNAKTQRAQREERQKQTKGQKNAPQSRAFEMLFK